MKKTIRFYIYAWIVLAIVFNIIVFATPVKIGTFTKFGGAFIASYLLVMITLICQGICTVLTFSKNKTKEQLFLNIPAIVLSYVGLVVTIVIAVICFAIPDLPNWVAAVSGIVILALYAIVIIKSTAAAELIDQQDKKIALSKDSFRRLSSQAENLYKASPDLEIKAELKKVYESFRYSAPRGNDEVTDLEKEISEQYEILSSMVTESELEDIKKQANEIIRLINERNSKLKR